jgi:DNA (cytosine-5)-methyltransferase 1
MLVQQPVKLNSPWPEVAWNVGDGRHTAPISAWPKRVQRKSIESFLRHPPRPLSARATGGFLRRADVSGLNFPEGFLEALATHLAQGERQDGAATYSHYHTPS